MSKPNSGWTVIDATLPVLVYEYTFAPGAHSNALAVGGPEGLVVFSPPSRPKDETFAELEKHGKVRALVASNALHHLGLPAWKARYPDAPVFAPAQSIARVEKKSGIKGIRPIREASALVDPAVELVDMPFYRTGEVLVRITTATGLIWCITDLVLNLAELPKPFPIHQIFKWTKSGPGLRPNGVGPLYMVKDRPSLYRWMRDEIRKAPPTMLLLAHGDAVVLDPPGKQLLDILPGG